MGFLITGQRIVSASLSTEPLPTKRSVTDSKALSTSFEKTCMRQIHCLGRPSAMVNKGPYHAQGLFSTMVLLFFVLWKLRCAQKPPKTAHFRFIKWIFDRAAALSSPSSRTCLVCAPWAAFLGPNLPKTRGIESFGSYVVPKKLQKRLISGS